MTDLENLFFELIRVAIGTQDSLSRLPSEREWNQLYKMAEKQSLVGLCFAGLQILGADADVGFSRIGMSEMLYMNWMGMAFTIQETNNLMNRRCVELQRTMANAGFDTTILKGQGIGALYGNLALLRQSGDIDIYAGRNRMKAINYARELQDTVEWDYKHLHLKAFCETEVEIHYRPEYLANLYSNHIFQSWATGNVKHLYGRIVKFESGDIVTPDIYFNSVYVLVHIYNHNMRAGVGLRQLLDYYFVLSERSLTDLEKNDIIRILKRLEILGYAKGVMWIMQTVFCLKAEFLICEPDKEEGQYILDGVLIGGNMGRGYMKPKNGSRYRHFISSTISYSLRTFRRYPIESISYIVWVVAHFIWKRAFRIINGV